MGPRRAPPEPLSLRGSDLGCEIWPATTNEYYVPSNTVSAGAWPHLRANAAELISLYSRGSVDARVGGREGSGVARRGRRTTREAEKRIKRDDVHVVHRVGSGGAAEVWRAQTKDVPSGGTQRDHRGTRRRASEGDERRGADTRAGKAGGTGRTRRHRRRPSFPR